MIGLTKRALDFDIIMHFEFFKMHFLFSTLYFAGFVLFFYNFLSFFALLVIFVTYDGIIYCTKYLIFDKRYIIITQGLKFFLINIFTDSGVIMSYKNTMKVFSSNFALVWKQVLYFSLCLIFFGFCSYQVAKPLIEVFRVNSIGEEITNMFNGFYTRGANLPHAFVEIVKHIFDVVCDNFSSVYGSLLLLCLFAVILPYVFFQVGSYNLCSVIYKKLSMNMNVSYFQNLIGTLKYSIVYGLSNLILTLTFFALKIIALEIYISVANNIFLSYLGLVVLSGVFIFLDSVKGTFNSCYIGNAVETESFAPFAFGNSIPTTIKNFANILSNCVVLEITIIVANGFIGFFTFFAGLILSIPATAVLEAICFIIIYSNKTGQRYYLGNSVIYNPVKYEVKQEDVTFKSVFVNEKAPEQIETTVMKKPKHKKHKKHGKNPNSIAQEHKTFDMKKGGFIHNHGESLGLVNHEEQSEECACGHHHGGHSHGEKHNHKKHSHGDGEKCACGHNHGAGHSHGDHGHENNHGHKNNPGDEKNKSQDAHGDKQTHDENI